MCTVLYVNGQPIRTYPAQHRRQSVWEGTLGKEGHMYTYGCAPETVTTLLIGYTPIYFLLSKKLKQNKVNSARYYLTT